MHHDLITAAEAALVQLKDHHNDRLGIPNCPTPEHCPTAAAIANLEAEIAKAKRQADPDPEFQAVAPFKVQDYITIDVGDLANAILRAKP